MDKIKLYDQKFFELFSCFFDSFGIGGIDDVNQGVSVREVVAPILTEGLLSSDVPYVQLEFIVGQVLDIEALGGGDCADVLDIDICVLRWRGP